MRIALGSDHVGVELKARVKQALDERHLEYHDFGPSTDSPVDYPDYAARVAESVTSGQCDRGILICGTGVGMAIAANKVPGIRAAQVAGRDGARLSREHNDANVLTLGARTTSVDGAMDIIDAFLATPFGGGRHQRRVDKVMALEEGRAVPVTHSGPPSVRDAKPQR
jgi:ribose 5-phosphate isomerase B